MSLSDLATQMLMDAASKGGSSSDVSRRYNEALQYLMGLASYRNNTSRGGGVELANMVGTVPNPYLGKTYPPTPNASGPTPSGVPNTTNQPTSPLPPAPTPKTPPTFAPTPTARDLYPSGPAPKPTPPRVPAPTSSRPPATSTAPKNAQPFGPGFGQPSNYGNGRPAWGLRGGGIRYHGR